jgi:hypothetical protein
MPVGQQEPACVHAPLQQPSRGQVVRKPAHGSGVVGAGGDVVGVGVVDSGMSGRSPVSRARAMSGSALGRPPAMAAPPSPRSPLKMTRRDAPLPISLARLSNFLSSTPHTPRAAQLEARCTTPNRVRFPATLVAPVHRSYVQRSLPYRVSIEQVVPQVINQPGAHRGPVRVEPGFKPLRDGPIRRVSGDSGWQILAAGTQIPGPHRTAGHSAGEADIRVSTALATASRSETT